MAELAAQIIRTSTCLKGIYLYSNLFNKHSTAAIWTAAASSPSIEVIEEFVFSTSACMNEEDARVAMCEFLAAALALRKFDMRWQTGQYSGYGTIKCATEDGEPGEVTIKGGPNGEVITRETMRTKEIAEFMIF